VTSTLLILDSTFARLLDKHVKAIVGRQVTEAEVSTELVLLLPVAVAGYLSSWSHRQ
jgi:hypothetical protein